jgi:hypothetical protein
MVVLDGDVQVTVLDGRECCVVGEDQNNTVNALEIEMHPRNEPSRLGIQYRWQVSRWLRYEGRSTGRSEVRWVGIPTVRQ